ncbi:MAG: hypothetical protein ABEH65_00370 [Halobacteriales archaeon]
MTVACTYCGCDITIHEPVFVEEKRDDGRREAGQFCNYACLAQYIDEQGLTAGTTCRIDLD